MSFARCRLRTVERDARVEVWGKKEKMDECKIRVEMAGEDKPDGCCCNSYEGEWSNVCYSSMEIKWLGGFGLVGIGIRVEIYKSDEGLCSGTMDGDFGVVCFDRVEGYRGTRLWEGEGVSCRGDIPGSLLSLAVQLTISAVVPWETDGESVLREACQTRASAL
ncbi:hypothetical protein Tco_0365879 [Tanacetum coccineum]